MQVRVTDEPWLDLLQHIQHGDCTEEQLSMLHRLVLTHEECPPTDFSSAPWSDALLVTPRHAVCMKWNLMCVKARTQAHGQMLINCPVLDTIQGQQLTMEERFAHQQNSTQALTCHMSNSVSILKPGM